MAGERRKIALSIGITLAVLLALALVVRQGAAPTSANPLGRVTVVDAGDATVCIVTTADEAKCWGNNPFGMIGDQTFDSSSVPVAVTGLGGTVRDISGQAGYTCAVLTSGGAQCWGFGMLGNPSINFSLLPLDVVGLTSGVDQIAVGARHSCVLMVAGGVKCWGEISSSSIPVDVPGLTSGVAAITAGGAHSCALTIAGDVKCWGPNGYGQLGDGTTDGSAVPVDVVGLSSGVLHVSGGTNHTCAVTGSGAVKCWGRNFGGVLGDGTDLSRSLPTQVVGLTSGVAVVDAGFTLTCAVTTSGGVKCWGGPYGSTPQDVPGITDAVDVSSGADSACALTASGSVRCWGTNGFGQLGDGSLVSRSVAADVVELTVKPTPTATPCPPGECPTATPTPICASDSCMAFAVIEDGAVTCHSGTGTKCTIPLNGSFLLAVDVVQAPADGYIGVQAGVEYGMDLTYKPAGAAIDEVVWPDVAFVLREFGFESLPGFMIIGGATSVLGAFPVSTFAGHIFELAFTCSSYSSTTEVMFNQVNGSIGTVFDPADGRLPAIFPYADTLTISCADPPPPVGGYARGNGIGALPPHSSSGIGVAVLVVVGALALLVALVAVRTARQRWIC